MMPLRGKFLYLYILHCCFPETFSAEQNCGKISKKATFIKQGQSVNHAWPWMGSLGFLNSDNSWHHLCGTSLVSSYHAVTAAHCTLYSFVDINVLQKISEGKLMVRLGDYNIIGNQTTNSQLVRVQSMSVHPGYLGFYHDLSVLSFSSQVTRTEFVSPVCLPEKSTNREDLDGKGLVITGWGDGKENGGDLYRLIVQVYSNKVCNQEYAGADSQTKKSYFPRQFTDDIFCTGDFTGLFTGSTCYGDSGGPLITFDKEHEQYLQIALVTGGIRCNGAYPNVFVRFDDESNLSWIKRSLNKTFKYSNDFEWSPWAATNNCKDGLCEWRRRCLACSGTGCRKCSDIENRCQKCSNKTVDKDSCMDKKSCFETDYEDYKFENWSAWTECSQTCGVGIRVRTRQCKCKGFYCNSCEGDEKQFEDCKVDKCDEAEIIDGCNGLQPDSWSQWSHWSVCSKSFWGDYGPLNVTNTNSAENGLTQRVRFGVIKDVKNCTKIQSRPCKISEADVNLFPFIPTEYCPLPVELGCSGTYSIIGECENIEKLKNIPIPAFTLVTISQKLGTHPVVCCPKNYTSALASDLRVGCNDENNIGLEGGSSPDVLFTCPLNEECIVKEACPLLKIIKKLSVEKPNLSKVLEGYSRRDCADRGTCCPRGPKTSLESGKCPDGSVCTYKWNCKEYIEARATISITKAGDEKRRKLIQENRKKVCDAKEGTICCNAMEPTNRYSFDNTSDNDSDYDTFESDDDIFDPMINITTPLEFKFKNECSNAEDLCTDFTSCQDLYINDTSELNVKVCGWNQDQMVLKVCCKKTGNITRPPVYPIAPGYDCKDKTEMCKNWADNGACQVGKQFIFMEPDLQPVRSVKDFLLHRNKFENIEVWDFMSSACSKSCNVCGNKGCKNEHHKCPTWARNGACLTNPFFMVHTCRESCGVCGFFSIENKQAQIIHRQDIRDYSNLSGLQFDCGRFDDVEKQRTKRNSGGDELSHLFSEGGISGFRYTGLQNQSISNEFYCEATLISDKLAISAAHCFDGFADNFGRSRNIKTISINHFNPEVIEINQIFRHPEYQYPSLYDDLAIIKLGRRVKYDFEKIGVTPVCLKKEPVQAEQIGKVIGRGLTENGNRGELLEAVVKIIDSEDCIKILNYNATDNNLVRRRISNAFPHGINYGIVCAVGFINDEGVFSGSCKGDSGGGLFVEENGRKKLAGIVSGGISCGKGYPGWYTRISYYLPWIQCIEANIAANNPYDRVLNECRSM